MSPISIVFSSFRNLGFEGALRPNIASFGEIKIPLVHNWFK